MKGEVNENPLPTEKVKIFCVILWKQKVVEPKQAMQTLQVCLAIPLTSIPSNFFTSVFSALYSLHKSLLEAFPQAVLHSIAAYMASLQHMLRGVMQRCHQTSEGAGCIQDQDLFSCAENMEKWVLYIVYNKG